MIYLDTSFIAPYYIQEATSSRVVGALSQVSVGRLAISDWTKTEFASLLARKVRMGELTQALAKAIWQTFEQDMKESFHLFEPARHDFAFASDLLLRNPSFGLRGADALHLAIAYRHNAELYTLDQVQLKAAQSLELLASDAGVV